MGPPGKHKGLTKPCWVIPELGQEIYCQFPFLEPGHPDYELGRLYPSLMAVVGAGTKLFLSTLAKAWLSCGCELLET